MTLAQDEARRRNAQHSTGPKTEEGKLRVRANAIKHGMYAKHPELQDVSCKYDGEHRVFLEAMREKFQPQDPLEDMIVEQIAVINWRLKRNHFAERKSMHVQPGREYALPPTGALERILRYERTMERELFRLVHLLEKLRASNIKRPARNRKRRVKPTSQTEGKG